MPSEKEPTREDLRRAERDVGANIPDELVGEDDGDVREVRRHPASRE